MLLVEENFIIYAANAYNNASCTDSDEFLEDLKRIKYIRKLFSQYRKTGEMNERLILNHLVVLYNVFSHRQCTNMLFFKLEEYWDCLKPFLEALNFLPERVVGIKHKFFILVTKCIEPDGISQERVRRIVGDSKR